MQGFPGPAGAPTPSRASSEGAGLQPGPLSRFHDPPYSKTLRAFEIQKSESLWTISGVGLQREDGDFAKAIAPRPEGP